MNVVLATLPFYSLHFPDLATGTLKELLRHRAGVRADCVYYNVLFSNCMSYGDYQAVVNSPPELLFSEWLTARYLHSERPASADHEYLSWAVSAGLSPQLAKRAESMCLALGTFFDTELSVEKFAPYDAVVLHAKYMNLGPSLLFAAKLKEMAPGLKVILFGELISDERQAAALARNYCFLDKVLAGPDYEGVVRALIQPTSDSNGRPLSSPDYHLNTPGPAEVITPDYDDYFASISPSLDRSLIVESSRGCWWYKCRFCSSRGITRRVTQHPPRSIAQQIQNLSAKYGVLRFEFADVCINPKFVRDLRVLTEDYDYEMFAEVKPDLTRQQIQDFISAGISTVQVGIETFSSPLLRNIEKGATALQNIAFLRNASELGLKTIWNLMYGFPEERAEDLQRTIDIIGRIEHLEPPSNVVRLRVDRGSDYYLGDQDHFVAEAYTHVFGHLSPDEQSALANYFQTPPPKFKQEVQALNDAVQCWRRTKNAALTARKGPGFLEIRDTRGSTGIQCHTLTGWQADAYVHCSEIRDLTRLLSFVRTKQKVSLKTLENFIRFLDDHALVAVDGEELIALTTRVHRHSVTSGARHEFAETH